MCLGEYGVGVEVEAETVGEDALLVPRVVEADEADGRIVIEIETGAEGETETGKEMTEVEVEADLEEDQDHQG